MIGQRIGQYQIVGILGEGGMGTVYEARNEAIDRQVAIKVMNLGFAQTPELAVRFFNEARACNQIAHPGLVQVLDVGQMPTGSLYLVMEFLKGETLEKRLRTSGRIAERRALGLLRQLASALKAVHEKQIVHRDIKPSNIMHVPDPDMPYGERIKLLDFGIAKMRLPEGATLTKTGQTIGTALYMAPEQCRGLPDVDAKADIYALGVVAFEMLAGHPPFRADETLTLLNMHVNKPPPLLRNEVPGVSAETAELVAKMLSKAREHRPSAAELLEAVDALLNRVRPQGEKVAPSISPWAPVALGMALLAGTAIWLVARKSSPPIPGAPMSMRASTGAPDGGIRFGENARPDPAATTTHTDLGTPEHSPTDLSQGRPRDGEDANRTSSREKPTPKPLTPRTAPSKAGPGVRIRD